MTPIICQTVDSIIVILDGVTHTVAKGEEFRYNKLLNLLESNKTPTKQELNPILNPQEHFPLPGFEMIDGSLHLKGNKLPNDLGIYITQNSDYFVSLYNFWLNGEHRDWESNRSLLLNVLNNGGYPLTEDGFYMAHSGEVISNDVFYSYALLPTRYQNLFKEKQPLTKIIENVLGQCSKKMKSTILKRCFKDGQILPNAFIIGNLFNECLEHQNLIKFIDQDFIHTTRIIVFDERIELIKDFLKEFKGRDKRIFNLFSSREDFNNLSQAVKIYNEIKSKISIDIHELEYKTMDDLYQKLLKESRKLEHLPQDVNMEKNFPALMENPNVFDLNKNFFLIYPKTNHDLIEWSSKMNNCIRGYFSDAQRPDVIIMALMSKKDKSMFVNFDFRQNADGTWRIREFKKRHNEHYESSKLAQETLKFVQKEIIEWSPYTLIIKSKNNYKVIILKSKPSILDNHNIRRIVQKDEKIIYQGFLSRKRTKDIPIQSKVEGFYRISEETFNKTIRDFIGKSKG